MDSSFQSQFILIVDDNPSDLKELSETFTQAGFQITIAVDLSSAIEAIERHSPALILFDVQLGGSEHCSQNLEFCDALKANSLTQDIPVLVLTTCAKLETKLEAFQVGAIDYLIEPVSPEEVIARSQAHLRSQKQQRHLKTENAILKQTKETLERDLRDQQSELKQAKQHLIQQDNLASLGQLVAGVAHEINNPVNFIYGNFPPASNYIQDLFDLIALYQMHYPQAVPEIENKCEEIDLDFLRSDLPKLLESMQLGTERVREIVLSLRNFSRLDEVVLKRVDVHEGLESTLRILGHRMKAQPDQPAIHVIRDYDTLPLMMGAPGQLNQVFMNLLSNAIDALEPMRLDSDRSELPTIRIHTQCIDHNTIQICISDNGPGIPEVVQQKIFSPFFTTKPIGKGTGLGLSISHQIIHDKHHGKLECRSLPEEGTEFCIQLPISQSSTAQSSTAAQLQTPEESHRSAFAVEER